MSGAINCGCDPDFRLPHKGVESHPNGYFCHNHRGADSSLPKPHYAVGHPPALSIEKLAEDRFGPIIKEVRIVDPKTGGEKGSKLARFDLIPPEASWALAEVYGYGCRKYADRNWEKGYTWGLSIGALERHLNLWKQGFAYDTIDGKKDGPMTEGEHTGSHHLMQVAWHAFALFTYQIRGLGTDDRGI